MKRRAALALILLLGLPVHAQQKPDPEAEKKLAEEGIPVTSELVRKSCGGCHKSDDKGRMTRISYRRTTPEGWQHTVRRMVSLNGVSLTPADAREIVRYLADNHGLAPEEVRPAAFEVEKRIIDFKYTADADTEQTCIKCHSIGRVLMQRRAKKDWELLLAMHRGYYPLVDFQSFRRMGPVQTTPGPDGRPPDNRHPMEKALAHLSTAFPLVTPEWSSWSANMPQRRVEGRWAVSGYQTGKGPVYGEVNIRYQGDEIITESHLTYARSGEKVERAGKGVLYTGFQWRGRSMVGGRDATSLREVMFVERNQREMWGRWFAGSYDEIGIDVRMERIGNDPVILGVDVPRLQQGAKDVRLTAYGFNLSGVNSVSLGAGVTGKVVEAAPTRVVLSVSADAKAPLGQRDLFLGQASKSAALAVYDKIDGLKLRPQWGMARVGGNRFPKGLQQFEAVGYSNGPDGKPDTKDDIDLGVVDVTWGIEEFTATFNDDDKEFVGSIDSNGLFTPTGDGPNPSRSGNRNNIGDVWVTATHQPSAPKPLRARAHLLVAPPVYMRFDQHEVSQ